MTRRMPVPIVLAVALVLLLPLAACQSPTQAPTTTPAPTIAPTASPTPVVPTLSRADVDRIGNGFLADYLFALAKGGTPSAIGPHLAPSKPYPASFAIREGGTVSFTYSYEYPYKGLVYVVSKTVRDDTGTTRTDEPTAARLKARWTIRYKDGIADFGPFLGSYGKFCTGRVDDVLAAFGPPLSDKTDTFFFGQPDGFLCNERTIRYPGATFVFLQSDFSDPGGHWMIERAEIADPAFDMERGLAIGMPEADAVAVFDTGDYAILRAPTAEFDLYAGYDVYDAELCDIIGAQCLHLNIGITDGKVTAFGFYVTLDG